ncbi:MAG: amidohydrolase family protein [Nitrospirota bacterium]|nr:amidohydrolase family protein [Nitrospirota bacterium]
MRSKISKWMLGVLIVGLIIAAGAHLFVSSEIDHVLGGDTDVVDIAHFKTVSGKLAIANVNLLSTDALSMLPNQTVLVEDRNIESVGQDIVIPADYHVIDGTGQYLIPGLVDSHVHIKKSRNDLLLYVVNGVTQVGEMTGMESHFELRKQIQDGALGPDIFIASPKVTSQAGLNPTLRSWYDKRHQIFISPEAGREAVREYKAKGYEAIKIGSDLSVDIYIAINDEAGKAGLPVIGHLPTGLGLEDLYRSGQSQLAHLSSIIQATEHEFGGLSSANSQAYLDFINQNADRIAAEFKTNNIALSSTIWLHHTRLEHAFDLPNFLKTIELEYQNPGWIEGSVISTGWLPGNKSYENPNSSDAESQRPTRIVWNTYKEAIDVMIQALVRHGVTIMAGTDAHGAPGVIAGFSLHDELLALRNAGLSNAQVLHSATLAPAQWFGTNAGKIQPGHEADLVLLSKNPLQDIENTRHINAVITNGLYLDRNELDTILAAVKAANNRSRKTSIDAFLEQVSNRTQ